MNRNQRLALARGFLHDRICMSVDTCGADPERRADHARRTAHWGARAVVDAQTMADVLDIIHRRECDEERMGQPCPIKEKHTAAIRLDRDVDNFLATLVWREGG